MKIIGANITGSFILNSQDVTTTIQTSNVWSGSVATDITALNAATASLLSYTASNNATISDILLETASINLATASLLSYTASQNDRNGTYATTGSNTFAGIQTVNSNLVVTGSITAQTLVVQTITSSQDFVTGSTKFGSVIGNTHQFTGSVSVSGSVTATSFAGSGAGLTSIPNAALSNSTISGIALGSNLATLTIGTGLSGTSYNGSTAVTIANSGVTSNVAGTGISVSGATGAVTISIGQSVATSAQVTFDSVITNNNGNSTNVRLGDDCWIGDMNTANTFRVKGVQDGNAGYIAFGNQATQLGLNNSTTLTWGAAFTATGDVTAFSDKRVKENIKTIDSALSKVLQLRGVTYNRTDLEDKSEKIGVIAQEIQEILPQVVLEENDRLSVAYGNLAGVFIEAIKEQQTQIEELKTIINGLTK